VRAARACGRATCLLRRWRRSLSESLILPAYAANKASCAACCPQEVEWRRVCAQEEEDRRYRTIGIWWWIRFVCDVMTRAE
jgi:hypothetical protein